MTSNKIHEGELTIDHRASPGVPIELIRAARAAGKDVIGVGGEGTLFESATITCVHCNAIVVLNPDRSRPRNYCRRCDQYICDACAAVPSDGICYPFEQFLIDGQNAAYHRHED